MIIDPREAVSNGWIEGIVNPEKQIQPNAIDYTLDKVFRVELDLPFLINETRKSMRGFNPYEPGPAYINGEVVEENGWIIDEHSMIDCLSDMYVRLPEGVAAMLIPRSTFVRNGLFTQNGLYDSGFEGHIGTILHNRAGTAVVGQGTRLGQIMFIEAGTSGLYAGGYNHEQGTDLDYQS